MDGTLESWESSRRFTTHAALAELMLSFDRLKIDAELAQGRCGIG
jgi:hypothetical protein